MNTEREEVLRQLAEFEYPDWGYWVGVDSEGVFCCSIEDKPVFNEGHYETDANYCINIPNTTYENNYLFVISEINQAREEARANPLSDGKVFNYGTTKPREYYTSDELSQEPVKIDSEGKAVNDWYNRETVQDNINSMFPERPQPEYKCDQCNFETISKSMMIEHYHKVHDRRVSSSMMFGDYGSLIK